MSVRRAALGLALSLVIGGCAAEIHTSRSAAEGKASWSDDTDVAWSEMQRVLGGRWRAETKEKRTIDVSYRLVSRGSALVETFVSASGRETLTVYHRDGRALMLTHYCAQGNQARLKATVATRDRIVFTFLDVTNRTADQDVMQELTFVFRDDGFDQETVYRRTDGSLEATTLHFARVVDPPPS